MVEPLEPLVVEPTIPELEDWVEDEVTPLDELAPPADVVVVPSSHASREAPIAQSNQAGLKGLRIARV